VETPDVVVLVPGFLGFSRFGGFYYFAERVVAVLRGVLEERLGYPVQVVPCTTHPTDALAKRQRHLLDYLRNLCTTTLAGVERIHLVGHSTGGLDAQLLTCTKPLDGRAWGQKANAVRRKIRSVVTISAPHYGTCLADSWLAYWAENPFARWAPIVEGIQLGYHVLRLVPKELPAIRRFQLARDVIAFLAEVAFHRELIDDLRPANMEKLRSTLKPEPGVALTCFVTGTGLRARSKRPSDTFFTDMYDLTMGDGNASPAVDGCRRLLQDLVKRKPDLVIRSDRSRMPRAIHAALNDGVVNTVRQVVDPDDLSQVGGFVVADHADVLGHYDRQDSLIEGSPYNAGLFHSGAGFGDDEFFKLYRRVAEAILR
jgi:pimeloyl-ACP methyl ester carboxylesterase